MTPARAALCGLLLAAVTLGGGCARLPLGKARTAPPPMILWVDWEGLQQELATPAAAAEFCARAKRAGTTHLALEATDPEGRPAIGAGVGNRAEALLRREATAAGLRLAVAYPLFVAPPDAPANRLLHRAEWTGTAWHLTAEPPPGGLLRYSPADPQAASAEWERLAALAAEESYDYIILAGLGFDDPLADVGPAARRAFELASTTTTKDWPQEAIGWQPAPVPYTREGRGPLYDQWIRWRAGVLQNFVAESRQRVTLKNGRGPKLVALVDAPYQAHLRGGLNWAGPAGTPTDAGWLPEGYRQTAAGGFLDAVALQFWEPEMVTSQAATEAGYAWWASAEASGATARRTLPGTTKLWSFVPVDGTRRWAAALATAPMVDGMIVGPASELSQTPGAWEALGR